MGKVYIISLANVATGGTELLHQLCAELRQLRIDAYMLYCGVDETNANSPQPSVYERYNVPFSWQFEDCEDNVVIIPETRFEYLSMVKKAKKYFWWLSVDFLYSAAFINITNVFSDDDRTVSVNICQSSVQSVLYLYAQLFHSSVTHLVQSAYALNHCRSLGLTNVKYLGDYLRDDFIENIENINTYKCNVVAFNPRKGYDFTSKLMDCAPDIEWFPLQNLSPKEMSYVLRSAKVYIDFGNHPGMDRIPREAAISGCCVITGKKGSAAFFEDVPIPSKYKFDDNSDNVHQNVITLIRDIFDDYPDHNANFEYYRSVIRKQKNKFIRDVKNIFCDGCIG